MSARPASMLDVRANHFDNRRCSKPREKPSVTRRRGLGSLRRILGARAACPESVNGSAIVHAQHLVTAQYCYIRICVPDGFQRGLLHRRSSKLFARMSSMDAGRADITPGMACVRVPEANNQKTGNKVQRRKRGCKGDTSPCINTGRQAEMRGKLPRLPVNAVEV